MEGRQKVKANAVCGRDIVTSTSLNAGEKPIPSCMTLTAVLEHKVEREIQSPAHSLPAFPAVPVDVC